MQGPMDESYVSSSALPRAKPVPKKATIHGTVGSVENQIQAEMTPSQGGLTKRPPHTVAHSS